MSILCPATTPRLQRHSWSIRQNGRTSTMIHKTCLVTAIGIAVGFSGVPAQSAETSVRAGVLTCDVNSGWGFVFGSTRDLKCTYTDNNGSVEQYTGHIDKLGVDIGYHAGGVMAWAVLAPTTSPGAGALAGAYG